VQPTKFIQILRREIPMPDKEVSGFLAEIRAILAALDIDRRIALTGFNGSELFAERGPDFHQRLRKYLSPQAIEAINKVSCNAFWFVLMAGTTAALAEHFPAGADDVQAALIVQRRIVSRDPGMQELIEKVARVNFDKLSKKEFEEAGQRSLILLQVGGPEGECLIFNPVFLP
jgi:hypothetical protein